MDIYNVYNIEPTCGIMSTNEQITLILDSSRVYLTYIPAGIRVNSLNIFIWSHDQYCVNYCSVCIHVRRYLSPKMAEKLRMICDRFGKSSKFRCMYKEIADIKMQENENKSISWTKKIERGFLQKGLYNE